MKREIFKCFFFPVSKNLQIYLTERVFYLRSSIEFSLAHVRLESLTLEAKMFSICYKATLANMVNPSFLWSIRRGNFNVNFTPREILEDGELNVALNIDAFTLMNQMRFMEYSF